jgi:hypothetical protein
VLGTPSEPTRDADTLKLLQYGFSLYHPVQPVNRGEQLADPKLDYRSDHLSLVAQRALPVNLRHGQHVTTRVTAPDEISGAVKKGQVLGHVTVSVDGRPAAASPLVAASAVGAATTFDKVTSVAKNPILLLVVGAIVILLGVLLIRRRHVGSEPEAATPRADENGSGRQAPTQRTPEERRRMHEERMRRRRQRAERKGGAE